MSEELVLYCISDTFSISSSTVMHAVVHHPSIVNQPILPLSSPFSFPSLDLLTIPASPPHPPRPVMAPIVATCPSPPPLWLVTESCGLLRWRVGAPAPACKEAFPGDPPSLRSVTADPPGVSFLWHFHCIHPSQTASVKILSYITLRCWWICFRIETWIKKLVTQRQIWAACAVFPSNRLVKLNEAALCIWCDCWELNVLLKFKQCW